MLHLFPFLQHNVRGIAINATETGFPLPAGISCGEGGLSSPGGDMSLLCRHSTAGTVAVRRHPGGTGTPARGDDFSGPGCP